MVGFRPLPLTPKTGKQNELGLSEYRTVLAEQRTLLAFLRTALSVASFYGAGDITGLVLAVLIMCTGTIQFCLIQPLFLDINKRRKDDQNKINLSALLQYGKYSTISVLVVLVSVSIAAIIHNTR